MPKLRFKGFSDFWKKTKLEILANRFDSQRIPIAEGQRIAGTTPYYGANGIQGFVEGFTHDGEFILVAEDGANDLVHYPIQLVKGKVWVNNHAHVIQAKKDKIINIFLGYSLAKTDFQPFLVGGGRAKLNSDALMKMEIFYTPNLFEQEQIGSFLSAIDRLIEKQKYKIEQFKTMKDEHIQKLFPRDGQFSPDMRIKSFSEKWIELKLSKLFGVVRNAFVGVATPFYVEKFVNGHFYLESNNIKDGKINRKTEVYINEHFYAKHKEKSLHENDIVMVQSGHVGHTAVITSDLDGSLAHALIMFQQPTKNIDSNFLNYQFQSKRSQKRLIKLTIGNTIKHLLASDLKEFPVLVPTTILEQKKIGNLLLKFDKLIEKEEALLNKYDQFKKSYLQRIFAD